MQDSVIRTRVICILADMSGIDAVEPISRVLEDDKNALVRHEAAFFFGSDWLPDCYARSFQCC